jgi:hypothetical protein
MTTPAPTPAPAAAPVNNKGLTIAGVVFAFLIPLLGLILSIVALVQSRGAGQKNGLAIAGIIISVVWPIILTIIITAVTASLGTCVVTVNGVQTAC